VAGRRSTAPVSGRAIGVPRAVRPAWERRHSAVTSFSMRAGGFEVSISVGSGLAVEPAAIVPPQWHRAVVVTQPGIPVPSSWSWPIVEVPRGERAKRLAVVERVAEELAELGLSRSDGLVALGGGVVSDLTGFVAAVYHRGIAYVNVPTTLLAMIDAAIGGKTAVNLRAGKNLVGAFWQPTRVVADLELLATLPAQEWRSGLGELVKYAFLGLDGLLDLPLDEAVAQAARLKASIVERDERESGERVLLNYGHTIGHAVEAIALEERRRWSHGESVGVGLVAEALVARNLGRIDDARVEEHRRVVRGVGLVAEIPSWAQAERILAYAQRDKKNRGSLAMVLDGPQGLELVPDVPEEAVRAALMEAAAQ